LGKDYKAEHANTLNNLSWALAESGDFDDALQRCKDGLDLRIELGAGYPIALSYNTLGLIETRNDQPHRARTNCERALAIFRELEMPRGIGMASTALSEAYRRMAAVEEVYFPEEQVDLMRDAARYAKDAVAIFGPYDDWPEDKRDAPQVPEPARLVEALIQLGCAYRDWLRLYPSYQSLPDDPDRETLTQLGERALREADQVARSQQPHRAVGALVNLAWLKYYARDLEDIEKVASEVQDIVRLEYILSKGPESPPGELDQPVYWVLLGKLHLLKGHVAFDQYSQIYEEYKEKAQRDSDPQGLVSKAYAALRESAEMYTLSLAYDDLYGGGHMFRDLKGGISRIYNRFKVLNVMEMRVVAETIQNTADDYHLKDPRLAWLMDKWFGLTKDSGFLE
jgi:hypothetical protein